MQQAMTKQSRRNWKKTLVDYSFVTPFMILFTLFTVLPVVVAILLSFTYFNMMEMPHVVWLENYINLFLNDSLFIKALQNTLIIAAITGPLGYVFSFVTAWVLNELPRGVRTVGTLVFYAPTLSGNMVAIWLMLFSGDANGYLNSFLMRLGMISNPIQFLRNPQYMLPVLVIIVLWSSLGF